jgi:hypothetical protein
LGFRSSGCMLEPVGYAYSIDEGNELATVIWTGDVRPEDAGEAIRAVAQDPRCRPNFRRLVDMRAARLEIPKQDNRELASVKAQATPIFDRHVKHGKTAIVVGDELSFGIASQYAAYSELQGVPTEVFRDVRAAEEWLELGRAANAAVPARR